MILCRLLQGCVDSDYGCAGTIWSFAGSPNREGIATAISGPGCVYVGSSVDPLQSPVRRPLCDVRAQNFAPDVEREQATSSRVEHDITDRVNAPNLTAIPSSGTVERSGQVPASPLLPIPAYLRSVLNSPAFLASYGAPSMSARKSRRYGHIKLRVLTSGYAISAGRRFSAGFCEDTTLSDSNVVSSTCEAGQKFTAALKGGRPHCAH